MAPGGPYPVFGGNGQNGVHDAYLFEESKIVIGRVGAYCGVVHQTPPRSWVTDNALYISELNDRLKESYLLTALRLANLNQYASQSGQPLISGGRIKCAPLLIPPAAEQEKFGRRLAAVGAHRALQASQASDVDLLFASVQDRAFKGEL
jgi:type I restriction enzyme S subunit